MVSTWRAKGGSVGSLTYKTLSIKSLKFFYRVLKELVGPLLEYEYYVVLFNSRGVGKSTKWPSLSALSEAEDLRELVQVLVQELAQAQSYIEQVVLAVSP